MGVQDFDVFGKYRFGSEEQFTHFCLVIEALTENDALVKAKKIAGNVIWTNVSKHNSDD